MTFPSDDDEETLLFSLVYCSRAVNALGADDIDQIVRGAKQHNASESITGWLVYSNGVFFQWLEGARAKVKSLMASITADPRHDAIVILSEAEELRTRLFSGWDMELVTADEIRSVVFDAIDASKDTKSVAALQLLLKELDAKIGQGMVDNPGAGA